MDWRPRLRGFYAVLDAPDPELARRLVGDAGASVLQLRIKPPRPLATAALVRAAELARRVTAAAGALLVIDDRVDVALAVDADGVHLGQRDLPIARVRPLLARAGRRLLIGVSTHDPRQVAQAIADGADYLGYGPVFATATKANPSPVVGLDGLAAAVALAGAVPVVAIGGIAPADAPAIARAGAAAACAIRAVNAAPDPGAAGRAIGAAWPRTPE
jgi:thiamine-phosphate pyrophosphorylase